MRSDAACRVHPPPRIIAKARGIKSLTNMKSRELDPQQVLPEALRHRWAAVPKVVLYQMFIGGALIGAGVAVSILGAIANNRQLYWGFPIALTIATLLTKVIPWERRANADLQRHSDSPTS